MEKSIFYRITETDKKWKQMSNLGDSKLLNGSFPPSIVTFPSNKTYAELINKDVGHIDENIKVEMDNESLFSMKFPRPKEITINPHPPLNITDLELAKIWSLRAQGKDHKYESYIQQIVDALINEKKSNDKTKRDQKSIVNNISQETLDEPQTLSFLSIQINKNPQILAMIDSGATRNLILLSLIQKWNIPFKKEVVNIQTASGSDTGLVVGSQYLNTAFRDAHGNQIIKTFYFLIAKQLNGHQAILSNKLVNDNIWIGIDKKFLLYHNNQFHDLPIFQRNIDDPNLDYIFSTEADTIIPPKTSLAITFILTRRSDYNKYKLDYKDHHGTAPTSIPHQTIFPQVNNFSQGTLYLRNKKYLNNNSILNDKIFHVFNNAFVSIIFNNSNKQIFLPEKIPLGLALLQHRTPTTSNTINSPKANNINHQINNINKMTFKGLNHAHPESFDDLSDKSDFTPLDEFKKIHRLTDIDYSDCPPAFIDKAKIISNKYKNAFSTSKLDIGKASLLNNVYMPIHTTKHKVSQDKKRIIMHDHEDYANQVIDQYIHHGLMEENSNSEFRTNITLVKKKSNALDTFAKADFNKKSDKLRIVFDVRSLNAITTETRPTTLPQIDDLHHKLKNHFVILVDINNFFTHISILPKHAHKTSFYVNERVIRALFAIQGLKQAPFYGQELLKAAFSQEHFKDALLQLDKPTRNLIKIKHINDFVTFYVDDGYLYATTIQELLALWEVFLILCSTWGIKLCPGKCQVITTRFNCLGFLIDTMKGEKCLDTQKISALLSAKVPNSLYELHSRLAQMNYISRYLPLFQIYTFPLSLLLKTKKFRWTQIEQQSWDMILLFLKLNVKILTPNPSENLVLTIDGSRFALGAALFLERNNKLALCQVSSKINSLTHFHKSSYCLELMSLHHALSTFQPQLTNCRATIFCFTDARSILYLKRMSSHSLLIQNLLDSIVHKLDQLRTIYIVHLPGPANLLSDIMSRSFENHFQENTRHPLSKQQALTLPPLPKNFILDADNLLKYLSTRLNPEISDIHNKDSAHSTPPKILDIYRSLKPPSPEERFYTVMKLLAGNNLVETPKKGNNTHSLYNATIIKAEKSLRDIYMTKITKLLDLHFNELKTTPQYTKLKASLEENYKLLLRNEHASEIDRTEKIRSNWTKINDQIDQISNNFRPNIEENAINETTECIKLNFIQTIQNQEPMNPFKEHITTIWVTDPDLGLKIEDNTIEIDTPCSLLLNKTSYDNFSLPFLLEIDDFSFQHIHSYMLPQGIQLIINNYDILNMALNIQLINKTEADIQINHIKIKIQVKAKNEKNEKLRTIQFKLIDDVPPANLLEKIINPQKIYNFYTRTNMKFNKNYPNNHQTETLKNLYHTLSYHKPKSAYLNNTELKDKLQPISHLCPPTYNIKNIVEISEKIPQLLAEKDILQAGELTESLVKDFQAKDPTCKDILKNITSSKSFTLINKLLYKLAVPHNRLVIPENIAYGIVRSFHSSYKHPSATDLYKRMKDKYSMFQLLEKCKEITDACFICAIAKDKAIAKPNKSMIRRRIDDYATVPRRCITMDIIFLEHPIYPYCLIIMDIFSGFLHATPMKSKNSENTASAILTYFMTYDIPECILSDGGSEFMQSTKQLLLKHSVKHFTSYSYSQHLNNIEASVRLIKQCLRTTIKSLTGSKGKEKWPQFCQLAISYINKKRFTDLNLSRHQLFFGTDPIADINLFHNPETEKIEDKVFSFLQKRDFLLTTCQKIKLNQIADKTDSKIQQRFKTGQIVFQKIHHKHTLHDQYQGPFQIMEIHNQGARILDLSTNQMTFSHTRYLKHFCISQYIQTFPKKVIDNFSKLSEREPPKNKKRDIIPASDRVTRSSMKKNHALPAELNTLHEHLYKVNPHPSKISLCNIKLFSIDIKSKNNKREISLPKSSIIGHITIINLPKLTRQKRTKLDFDKISIKYF